MAVIDSIDSVKVVLKANIYFDGKVVSHTLLFPDGSKKTVGVIYPGSFNFTTGAAERMDIVSGACEVRLKGDSTWKPYAAGSFFKVPAKSAFDIKVASVLCEYLCSFE